MFLAECSYPFIEVGRHSGLTTNRKFVKTLTIYRFRTSVCPYLAEVEEYEHHIYIIKFYRRRDKANKERYNILTNENNCSRIVGTCLQILMHIYRKDNLASFGFLGSNTIDKSKNIFESKDTTKRFKVYQRAVSNLFGERTFTHYKNTMHSCYLAISNNNPSVELIKYQADSIFVDLVLHQ